MITQHFTPADYVSVPWKNGQGTTLELASGQLDGALARTGFLWRISIADMVESAEFSRFEGVARILTVIAGHGLQLRGGSFDKPLACMPFEPVSFAGDAACFGHLLDGPVKNFNVMVDEGSACATVHVHDLPKSIQLGGDFDFFYLPLPRSELLFSVDGIVTSLFGGDSFLVRDGVGEILSISSTNPVAKPMVLHVRVSYLAA